MMSSGGASSSKTTTTTTTTTRMKTSIAQYNRDAMLIDAFERSQRSGIPFNYPSAVQTATDSTGSPRDDDEVPAYLNKIQRGGLVQPFGCLLCVEESPDFSVLAYSENAPEFLGPVSLGSDARTLFAPPSAASFAKAVGSKDLSLLNPVWLSPVVATDRHLYGILHRVDVGIVVDLEPAACDPSPSIGVGTALQSQKLTARVISRLQSLPRGDVGALCGAIVGNVKELTGYDRVMVYKFHEDGHGEVIAEDKRPDLEPYLGLHYPATDVPQAARFLFKQNKVRIICDCNAKPVPIVQDNARLRNVPLCLVNSTLRAPHGCHAEYMANMGSIASLTMAIATNVDRRHNEDSSSLVSSCLWGLVVCHHATVRYLPFPLRSSCQLLTQAFTLQLGMELQLLDSKMQLQTQALLCDVFTRGRKQVHSILTGSPNIMDLVKCNGAAIYLDGKFYSRGTTTPTESQLADIMAWLVTTPQLLDSTTGLFSTDSLAEAGYPNAPSLGEHLCGMASARINVNDFVFWFRHQTSKEIKWGGAKHHPEVKDDGGRMHPRMSFNAFLEVMRSRSIPWEEAELNAIRSFQLIARTTATTSADITGDHSVSNKSTTGVDVRESGTLRRGDEFSTVAWEMVKLIETAIVPVIAVDSTGLVNGWNRKAAELTGLPANEAMGKSLVYELIYEDSRPTVKEHLSRALEGNEDKDVKLKLRTFDLPLTEDAVFIVANACCSRDYKKNIIGVCFVGQDVTDMKILTDKLVRLQGDYKTIVQSLNPLIPAVFTTDENTCCSEWNAAMEVLTGWRREEVIQKLLVGEIFGNVLPLKDQEAITKIRTTLHVASSGEDTENIYIGFYDKNGKYVETFLSMKTRTDINGNTIGCIGFLQKIPSLDIVQMYERELFAKLKELAYIRQEIKNPLNGLHFTHQLFEETNVSDEQRWILEASASCEQQLMKILEDTDIESLASGCIKLNIDKFFLGGVISAVVSQMIPNVRKKKIDLLSDIPEEIKMLNVYGDKIRLQQVLANLFLNVVLHAPSTPESWVKIEVIPISTNVNLDTVHLHFRMSHPGCGLPSELIDDMFNRRVSVTHEGLVLNIASKLLEAMKGKVQYIREAEKCYFLVDVSFQDGVEADAVSSK